MRKPFLAAALLLAGTFVPARAELMLQEVSWEAAAPVKGKPSLFIAVETFKTQPSEPKRSKLRAKLTLKNRGPKAVEGILLRYALTARLAQADSSSEGTWAVPFTVEEKRVPRIGANQILDVALGPSPMIDLYLKKLGRTGFWPDELKIQVMIEPFHRAEPSFQVLEKTLPVSR